MLIICRPAMGGTLRASSGSGLRLGSLGIARIIKAICGLKKIFLWLERSEFRLSIPIKTRM